MAKMNRKVFLAVGAVALALVIVAAVVIAVVVVKNKSYTPVEDIDLSEYQLVDVEFDRDLYLNEPDPQAALVFRNGAGEEKRAQLSEADSVTGLDTSKVGEGSLSVTVEGQSVQTTFRVVYKNIYFKQTSPVCLSLYDAFELKTLFASCTDYSDSVAAIIPLSEIFSAEDLRLSTVTDTAQTAAAEYEGFSFTLSYTVGYLGYRNFYCGAASVTDGTRSFRLERLRFFLGTDGEQTRTDAASGYGTMNLVTEGELDDYGDPLTFDWEVDAQNPDLIVLHLDRVSDNADGSGACVYDMRAHTLKVSASVMSTASDLIFRLRLDSLPAEA